MACQGSTPPLKIAIAGTRGIPACYGGFETFAEELSCRLVKRGHHVMVYGRKHVISHPEPLYKGVELRLLSAPQHKYLETPMHSLYSMFDVLRRDVDVLLVCNAANSPFIWIPRFLGRLPVAVNVDGIERKRSKWNSLGRAWYRLGELTSVWFANEIIADADIISRYYSQQYRRNSEVIRYGFRQMPDDVRQRKLSEVCSQEGILEQAPELFEELGVLPGQYLLYVSRLEPENNAHRVLAAYAKLPEEIRRRLPLLIVGDAPYAAQYISQLHDSAVEGVLFAGYRFGKQYEVLQQGAYAYIQATEVGGTHPALVEAMGFANCIIANRVPEHVEVVKNCALLYPKNDVDALAELLMQVIQQPQTVLQYRKLAFVRAMDEFAWEKIVDSYEELFYRMAGVQRTQTTQTVQTEIALEANA